MDFSIAKARLVMGLVLTMVWALLFAYVFGLWVGAALMALGWWYYGFYMHTAYQYHLEDGRLTARIGWLANYETHIDREQVTDVHLSEPIADRLLGMASVKINTAGSDGSELEINHIDADMAREVREQMYAEAS